MTDPKQTSTGLKIEYAVFCEGVGKEVTGKDILVGAVPDGLMAPTFPMIIRCAFWFVVFAENASGGQHNVRLLLHVKGEQENKIADFTFGFLIPEGTSGRNAFGTPSVQVTVKEPITATLSWSIDDSDLVFMRDIPFQKIMAAE
ncbi:hypothetical protein JUN65_08325 [Gluconacetobacter azotocaptans]|uniref:hypothetical protein n=1 Tax=Gluconacetobacter azotocaptans TaxID=142834 RepID=UPI001955FE59|nr:hypothetical protein [Gluconacetobacter azotocaptans]MBM9401591.1 hypothetical protein [Gluconacetobacter azotocaptans]